MNATQGVQNVPMNTALNEGDARVQNVPMNTALNERDARCAKCAHEHGFK